MNAILEESSTTKEESVENKEEYLAMYIENKKVIRFAGECPTTELRCRRICYQ